MSKDLKGGLIFYSKLIISLLGLFSIMFMYIPNLIFFFTKLQWNLNGAILRLGMITGLVFIPSYFYHLFSKRRLLWIILNVVAIRIAVAEPFYILKGIRHTWDYLSSGRLLEHLLNMTLHFSFYSLPVITIITLIISVIIGIFAVYRLRWIAGISCAILIILISPIIPLKMFFQMERPVFGDVVLDRKIKLMARSRALKDEYKEVIRIEMKMVNARDLIVFPDRRKLFAFFGEGALRLYGKRNLFLNLDYSGNDVKYNIFKEPGAVRRAKRSRDGSKIYFANWDNGSFYVMDVQSGKIVQSYNIRNSSIYLFAYRDKGGKRVPEYIRYSDESRYLIYEHKQRVFDIMDFHVDESSNELVLLFDHVPIIQKYRMHPEEHRLEFLADCCFFSGGAEPGSGCLRLFYDAERESYFIMTYNSAIKIFEIDDSSFNIKRTFNRIDGPTSSLVYNPKNRSLLLSDYIKDVLYEVSLDSLRIVNRYPMPHGLRSGYVDADKNLFYFLDYALGKFYIYDPVNKKINHSYEIGRRPIALDVHPEINRAFFVSSYGIMELDIR